jgi:CsoR family transcriptional regulator, copper-sensing transcriptional repressor
MNTQTDQVKEDIQKRLRRIEGQVRGVQKMLDDGRECREIIQQLTAIRSAVQNASALYIQAYTKQCLRDDLEGLEDREQLVDDLISLMSKLN